MRKIDDSVMAVIEIDTMSEKEAADYEAMFSSSASSDSSSENSSSSDEEQSGSSDKEPAESEEPAEANPLTAGTKFKKGSFSDGVYTNEYAAITLNVPDYLFPGDSVNREVVIPDGSTDADKLRIKSEFADAEFWKSPTSDRDTDFITVFFLNTELGMPDKADCSEVDLLDAEKDYLLRTIPMKDTKVTYGSREKVTLSGHEYLREICWIESTQILYTYARKIDDDLMCAVQINIGTDESIGDYEKWFE